MRRIVCVTARLLPLLVLLASSPAEAEEPTVPSPAPEQSATAPAAEPMATAAPMATPAAASGPAAVSLGMAATVQPAPAPVLVQQPGSLQPEEREKPFYKKVWFWTGVGVVAAAAVIIIIASSGGGQDAPKTDLGDHRAF